MIQLVSDRSAMLAKLWSAEIAPQLTLLQACQFMALDPDDIEHFEGEPREIANAIWAAGLFLNQGDEPGTGRLLPIDEGRFRAKFPDLVGLLPAFSEPGVFLPAGPLKLRPAPKESRRAEPTVAENAKRMEAALKGTGVLHERAYPTLINAPFHEVSATSAEEDAPLVYAASTLTKLGPLCAAYGFSVPQTLLELKAVEREMRWLEGRALYVYGSAYHRGKLNPAVVAEVLAELEQTFPGSAARVQALMAGESNHLKALNHAQRIIERGMNLQRVRHKASGQPLAAEPADRREPEVAALEAPQQPGRPTLVLVK